MPPPRFFSDCDEETVAWAATQLCGQFWRITEELTPLQHWPDVPADFDHRGARSSD
jgi:hypothetical protein